MKQTPERLIARKTLINALENGQAPVLQAAAKSNMKIVTLELGGKSPALIFDDAELDNAVANTAGGFLRNSGQVCFAIWYKILAVVCSIEHID